MAPAILQSSVTLSSHKYVALSRPHFSIGQNPPPALVFRNFVHGSPSTPFRLYYERNTSKI